MSAPTTPAIPGYHSPSLLRDRSDFSRWRATEDATGRVVELLVPHDDAPPQVVAHALLVHRHIAQVDSPFVQRVLAVGSDAARPYVALERLDGRSLYDAVKADGPLSLPRLLRLARQSAGWRSPLPTFATDAGRTVGLILFWRRSRRRSRRREAPPPRGRATR